MDAEIGYQADGFISDYLLLVFDGIFHYNQKRNTDHKRMSFKDYTIIL